MRKIEDRLPIVGENLIKINKYKQEKKERIIYSSIFRKQKRIKFSLIHRENNNG